MIRNFIKRHGAVNIGTIFLAGLGLITGLVSVVYSNLNQRVSEVEAKSYIYTADISSIKQDLSWIKSSLQARGFQPIEKSLASSTSYNGK